MKRPRFSTFQRHLVRYIKHALAVLFFLPPSCGLAAKLPQLYIRDHQYRFLSEPDDRCSNNHPADQQLCYSSTGTGTNVDARYSMNFIEFSDKGVLFDHHELDAALKRLDDARSAGQHVIVFIYIHGWHNNAGPRNNDLKKKNCSDNLYDGDVAKFELCGVRRIAEQYHSAPGAKGPRVVGIYLAWHGEDFTPWALLIPYYVPSYIFRRHYAYTVGQTGMENALQQILGVIQQHRGSYFVITMGHSFGARALENADLMLDPAHAKAPNPPHFIENGLQMQLQPQLGLLPSSELPIDLVFYVNAATSNYRTIRTIHDWNKECSDSNPLSCGQDPLYFALSSRADVLTAIVMPIANIVFPAWSTDRFHIISAANTPALQTHSIPKRIPATPETIPKNAFCFTTHDGPNKYLYEVVPKNAEPIVRFWDMNSDHWYAAVEGMLHKIPVLRRTVRHDWIISAHGDVWNQSVFNMVYALIDAQSSSNGSDVTCSETRGMQFQMR